MASDLIGLDPKWLWDYSLLNPIGSAQNSTLGEEREHRHTAMCIPLAR
jgi:hypothetical protein